MAVHPYSSLPDHQFWRRAVSNVERFKLDPVVEARFSIAQGDAVATAGSCFAQHISARLASHGFNYLVTENGADLPANERLDNQYGVFSARYGNLYTTRQLLQLFQESFGERRPDESVWRREDGRFVDALRPQVQPRGYEQAEAVHSGRITHLDAVRKMFESCAIFVFTLGLTEAWRSSLMGPYFRLRPGSAGVSTTRPATSSSISTRMPWPATFRNS